MPAKNFPAYIFLGEEDFLKEEAVEKLKSSSLNSETRDLNYSMFYARERDVDINQMLDLLNTLPFLSKKRLIVLKDADSLPAADKKSILSYLRNPRESSVFVIESASSFIKGEFLLEASRLARLVYFRRLPDTSVDTWLDKKANMYGKRILPDAIKFIKESLPNDLRMLSLSMDNVILFVGRESIITKEDIEKVVGKNPAHTSSDLIDSIAEKNIRRSLGIVFSLKRDKKKETELLGLLGWNARMLLRVKELLTIKNNIEIRQGLALNPRSFDRIVRQADRLERSQILALLDELLKADIDIKTGMPMEAAIERLIVKMCS